MISGISGVSNYDYLWQLGQYGSQSGKTSADKVFSKIDANGDGSISKDELSAFQSNMQTQFKTSVMGSQTDSTSLLNLLEAISQAATTNGTSGTTAGSASQSAVGSTDVLFSKIDTNLDGSISKDELSAFQSKLDAQSAGSATGTSTATSAVSNQQSQTNSIKSLLTQAISMYMQFSKLNPVLSGMGSFAATG
jgi:Ca2+-binding EF-hand superfamily protein